MKKLILLVGSLFIESLWGAALTPIVNVVPIPQKPDICQSNWERERNWWYWDAVRQVAPLGHRFLLVTTDQRRTWVVDRKTGEKTSTSITDGTYRLAVGSPKGKIVYRLGKHRRDARYWVEAVDWDGNHLAFRWRGKVFFPHSERTIENLEISPSGRFMLASLASGDSFLWEIQNSKRKTKWTPVSKWEKGFSILHPYFSQKDRLGFIEGNQAILQDLTVRPTKSHHLKEPKLYLQKKEETILSSRFEYRTRALAVLSDRGTVYRHNLRKKVVLPLYQITVKGYEPVRVGYFDGHSDCLIVTMSKIRGNGGGIWIHSKNRQKPQFIKTKHYPRVFWLNEKGNRFYATTDSMSLGTFAPKRR